MTHILSYARSTHPINTPYQYTLSIPTLSTHPLITLYQYPLSTHPLNASHHPIRSRQKQPHINSYSSHPLYPSTLSPHPQLPSWYPSPPPFRYLTHQYPPYYIIKLRQKQPHINSYSTFPLNASTLSPHLQLLSIGTPHLLPFDISPINTHSITPSDRVRSNLTSTPTQHIISTHPHYHLTFNYPQLAPLNPSLLISHPSIPTLLHHQIASEATAHQLLLKHDHDQTLWSQKHHAELEQCKQKHETQFEEYKAKCMADTEKMKDHYDNENGNHPMQPYHNTFIISLSLISSYRNFILTLILTLT